MSECAFRKCISGWLYNFLQTISGLFSILPNVLNSLVRSKNCDPMRCLVPLKNSRKKITKPQPPIWYRARLKISLTLYIIHTKLQVRKKLSATTFYSSRAYIHTQHHAITKQYYPYSWIIYWPDHGKREILRLDMTWNIPNNWKTIDFERWIMI